LRFASLGLLAVFAGVQDGSPEGPVQPVPFSHALHAGALALGCTACHANPDPGETMSFPALSSCMECHAAVSTGSPAIREIAAAAEAGSQLPWVRVYQIPSYVYFSHREHLAAGADCRRCHGAVEERERLFLEGDVTMDGCMSCHLATGSSLDCAYCHEPFEQGF